MGLLELLVVLLVIGWAFGTWGPYHVGPLIHVVLLVAIVVIIIRVLQGRRPLP